MPAEIAAEPRPQVSGSTLAAFLALNSVRTRDAAAAMRPPISPRRLREILRLERPAERDIARVVEAVVRLTGSSMKTLSGVALDAVTPDEIEELEAVVAETENREGEGR